jgi:hypothetical protein
MIVLDSPSASGCRQAGDDSDNSSSPLRDAIVPQQVQYSSRRLARAPEKIRCCSVLFGDMILSR